jgi:hypothetical protein
MLSFLSKVVSVALKTLKKGEARPNFFAQAST